MGKDYDTQADLLEATDELKRAMQQYHRAVNRAGGKPELTNYPVDKFVFLAYAVTGAGYMYHMGIGPDMPHHEIVGLVEVLRRKVS
jgi:hypothetical protein